MKKLLKKRVLIPLIVVVAVAIGGAIAYAAFTPPNAVSTANVSAGTTAITFTSTNTVTESWNAPDLVPTANPGAENGGPNVVWHQVAIYNAGNVAVTVSLASAATGNPSWDAYLDTTVYNDSSFGQIVSPTSLAGFSGVTIATIAPGTSVTVNIGLWLNAGTPNSFQGLTTAVPYTFTATT